VRTEVFAAIADSGGQAGYTSTSEAILFWVLAVVSVVGAIVVVASPKAVYSAIALALTMLALAVLYIA